jgi:Ca2+/H+ antiporter, TMEM165/GDT1 family
LDAFLLPLLAALGAEIGDKTHWLAALLAARFPARRNAVIGGIALAASLNAAVAAAGGHLLHGMMAHRPAVLLLGAALALAGAGGFWPARPRDTAADWRRLGPFGSSFAGFAILEFGDKTQFVTAAWSAASGSPALVAAGAASGVVIAAVPAVLAGPALLRRRWIRPVRAVLGGALLAAGFAVTISALRLA